MKRSRKRMGMFLVLLIGGILVFQSLYREAKQVTIQPISLEQIADGNYTGEYTLKPVYVKVAVCVQDHQITRIDILAHQQGLGKKAEGLVEDIIREQSLEVDGVSGATFSSQCLKKAIEQALEKER